jgi:hypothetical protein
VSEYRLDTLGIVEPEPVVLDDGSELYEHPAAGVSRAGVSVQSRPGAP